MKTALLKWSMRVGAFIVASMMLGASRELQVWDGVFLRAFAWGIMIAVFFGWDRTRIRSRKRQDKPESAPLRWALAATVWVMIAVLAPAIGASAAREEIEAESANTEAAVAAALRDVDAEYARLAQEYRVGNDAAPIEWLTPRYFADASRYPEVAAYLRRTADFTAEADRRGVEIARQSLRAHLRAAGLSEARADRQAEELLGLPAVTASFQNTFSLMSEWARRGQRLHEYLLRVDPRVQYVANEDGTLFESDAESVEVERLLEELVETTRQVEQLKVEMRASRSQLDPQ